MKNLQNLFVLMLAVFFVLTAPTIGNAAEDIQEKYCPVGSIISVNHPNTIYNARGCW